VTRSIPKARKKTAFVPRIIFQTVTAATVVPVVACGGKLLGNQNWSPVACEAYDGGPCDIGAGDVAAIGFDTGTSFVACEAFDGSPCGIVAADAFTGGDVAAIGFDGGDATFTVATTGFDGSDGSSEVDGMLGVAATGFDASNDKG
jgi:hypothetical protein